MQSLFFLVQFKTILKTIREDFILCIFFIYMVVKLAPYAYTKRVGVVCGTSALHSMNSEIK
jgi:hypothetical protein